MVSLSTSSERSAQLDDKKDESGDPTMRSRWNAVQAYWHRYENVMRQAGFEDTAEVRQTREWIRATQRTSRRDVQASIVHREEFFRGHGGEIISEGMMIHHSFMKNLEEAAPYISTSSKQKWLERYQDGSVGFQAKKYWIMHQFPYYVQRWKEVASEREKLLGEPGFNDLLSYEPEFKQLESKSDFLALHYDERKGLVAQARAAMLASRKLQLDYYAIAKEKLIDAEKKGLIGRGKTGVWLERIFKKSATAKQIDTFVRGSGPDGQSLSGLSRNWAAVRKRYDDVKKQLFFSKEETMSRGLHLVSEQQFLSMQYPQRERYVEEMEQRIRGGADISKEPGSFVRIRHAMDTKDWVDAGLLIAKAEKEELSEKDRERLSSMKRFVSQFKGKKTEGESSIGKANEAKKKIDLLLEHVPSTMQPMIMRLLRGPNANRSIHQLRWIVYNNQWCRTHGYLDDKKAAAGASKDNRELTKFRAKHGQDIGRNDTLDWDTADRAFFRKKEFADHKATSLHVNLKSAAPQALGEWLEHEQNPKVLYWTTFCGHEDGAPKSENWHNELLFTLTELRSATRTIKNAGYSYTNNHESLALAA